MNREEFINEINKIGLNLDNKTLSKLEEYYQILKEENTKYNLTRIIKKEDVYLKHFYDSLTIIRVIDINNQSICDLGSGAGFPGLVLGICFPESKVTLIEANGKKCYFLNLVKDTLKLDNVAVVNARVEDYSKENREVFDIVTARAVAPLKHLLEYGVPLVKVEGFFIAMKANMENEEENIINYYQKLSIKEDDRKVFYLPIEKSLRTIIKYKKLEVTKTIYPRRYSEIKRKSL